MSFFRGEGNSWQRHSDFLEGLEQKSLVRLVWSWVGSSTTSHLLKQGPLEESTCCFTSAPTIVFLKRTIENPYRLPIPTLQLLILLFICSSHETSQAPIWNFKNSFWKVSLFSLDFPSFPFYLLSKVFLTKGNIQGNFLISPFLNDCSAISMYNKDVLFHMILNFLANTIQSCIHLLFNLLLYVKSTYSLSYQLWHLYFFLERLWVIQQPLVYRVWVVWIASSTVSNLELATLISIHHCGALLHNCLWSFWSSSHLLLLTASMFSI